MRIKKKSSNVIDATNKICHLLPCQLVNIRFLQFAAIPSYAASDLLSPREVPTTGLIVSLPHRAALSSDCRCNAAFIRTTCPEMLGRTCLLRSLLWPSEEEKAKRGLMKTVTILLAYWRTSSHTGAMLPLRWPLLKVGVNQRRVDGRNGALPRRREISWTKKELRGLRPFAAN